MILLSDDYRILLRHTDKETRFDATLISIGEQSNFCNLNVVTDSLLVLEQERKISRRGLPGPVRDGTLFCLNDGTELASFDQSRILKIVQG